MSTEIGVIEGTGSRGVEMGVTRYFGGEAGVCIQLTAQQEEGRAGHVQLNAADIITLLPIFKQIIDINLEDKKREVEKAIKENQELRKTIMNDMREIAGMAISQPVFDMAKLMFYVKKEIGGGDYE